MYEHADPPFLSTPAYAWWITPLASRCRPPLPVRAQRRCAPTCAAAARFLPLPPAAAAIPPLSPAAAGTGAALLRPYSLLSPQ
ncbi:MAG: hypothetical protein J7463_05655 [Roseiflexus sp.]|nr:hypothetical protein [Roseiflexus sp.]MBO9334997.1 hypothetical protein [Roseiflexus sp.]MBO9341288.1 hypothetical protein [Roseiflexus sp.]MBO9365378.1 hypothetical protein [Roseiflexus sp.]MBO9381588.1 hypothetical protein [Roseiflexus sp.]